MRSELRRSTRRPATRDDRGATAVEYALLIAGVVIAILVGVALVGGRVSSGVATAAEGLTGGESSQTQTPADQTPADQTPADQTPADQTPANQTPADQTPVNPTPVNPAPVVVPSSVCGAKWDKDGSGSKYREPTSCNTSTKKWSCPSSKDELKSIAPGGWTCKRD